MTIGNGIVGALADRILARGRKGSRAGALQQPAIDGHQLELLAAVAAIRIAAGGAVLIIQRRQSLLIANAIAVVCCSRCLLLWCIVIGFVLCWWLHIANLCLLCVLCWCRRCGGQIVFEIFNLFQFQLMLLVVQILLLQQCVRIIE